MSGACNPSRKDEPAVCLTRTNQVGRPPRRFRYPCLQGGRSTVPIPEQLQRLLPKEYNHHVCRFRSFPDGYVATVRVDFGSAEEARRWLKDFQESSLTTFRSRRTFPRPGARLLYKAWFRCQRNQPRRTAAATQGARHTACPATLAISVVRALDSESRCLADPHLPRFPGCVEIKHVHNHSLHSSDSLRFRDVSTATQDALWELFERGYAPAAALRALRHQLSLQLGEKFALAAVDRAVLPSIADVCRIHAKFLNRRAEERCVEVVIQIESDMDDAGDCDNPDMVVELAECDAEVEDGGDLDREGRGESEVTDRMQNEGSVLAESRGNKPQVVDEADRGLSDEHNHKSDATSSGTSGCQTAGLLVDENQISISVEAGVRNPQCGESCEDGASNIISSTLVVTSNSVTMPNSPGHELVSATGLGSSDRPDSPPSVEALLSQRSAPQHPSSSPSVQVACSLQQHIQVYNRAMSGAGSAATARGKDGVFAAALITPLMRRVHCLVPQAGEVVYVESVNGRGCVLWLLVCTSEAGALPLGLLLASSAEAFGLALDCWHRILPGEAFCGRGAAGPQVLVADDQPAQRTALARQYPAAFSLLCAFRLLQAVWRWLHRRRLPGSDAAHLLQLAGQLLRAQSVSELEREHSDVITDPLLVRHAEFRRQLSSIYEHRHQWAVWYAEEGGTGVNQSRTETSFFSIAAHILCDRLLFMAAECRPAEAFDLIARHGDSYYVSRLESRLRGDRSRATLPRYVTPPTGLQIEVRRMSPLEHEVTIGNEQFRVLPWLACCTCKQGRIGAPCVHQSAVVASEPCIPPSAIPATASDRLQLLVDRLPLYDATPPPVSGAWSEAAAASVPNDSPADSDSANYDQLCHESNTAEATSSSALPCDQMACSDNVTPTEVNDDPEEVAMSEVICQLQGVTSDLTGRLAGDPAAYVPLVRSFVARYWQMVQEGHLGGLSEALTECFPGKGEGMASLEHAPEEAGDANSGEC